MRVPCRGGLGARNADVPHASRAPKCSIIFDVHARASDVRRRAFGAAIGSRRYHAKCGQPADSDSTSRTLGFAFASQKSGLCVSRKSRCARRSPPRQPRKITGFLRVGTPSRRAFEHPRRVQQCHSPTKPPRSCPFALASLRPRGTSSSSSLDPCLDAAGPMLVSISSATSSFDPSSCVCARHQERQRRRNWCRLRPK